MPTNFSPAKDVTKIAEMEYGSAASIQFGGFTSCLGLMALKDGKITGIHLGMFTGDEMFNEQDARDALALLPANPSEVILVGFCTQWAHDLRGPYQVLTAGLQAFSKRVINYNGVGVTVMAEVDGGRIVTTRVSH